MIDATKLVLSIPDAVLKELRAGAQSVPLADKAYMTTEQADAVILQVLARVNSPYVRTKLPPPKKKEEAPKKAEAPAPKAEPKKEDKAVTPAAVLTKPGAPPPTKVDKDFETEFPVTKAFKRLDKMATEMTAAYVFENTNKTQVLLKPAEVAVGAPEEAPVKPAAKAKAKTTVKIAAPPARVRAGRAK